MFLLHTPAVSSQHASTGETCSSPPVPNGELLHFYEHLFNPYLTDFGGFTKRVGKQSQQSCKAQKKWEFSVPSKTLSPLFSTRSEMTHLQTDACWDRAGSRMPWFYWLPLKVIHLASNFSQSQNNANQRWFKILRHNFGDFVKHLLVHGCRVRRAQLTLLRRLNRWQVMLIVRYELYLVFNFSSFLCFPFPNFYYALLMRWMGS